MALEAGNKEINTDIFSRLTQLLVFEEDVREIKAAVRLSQTHTICNIVVCLSAEWQKLSAVCSNILWMSVYGRAVCKLTVLVS